LSFISFTALLGLLGVGLGPMYPTSTIVMQNAVTLHHLGTATGTLNFFRLLGGAVIVAAFGAIVFGSDGDLRGATTLGRLVAAHTDLVPAFRFVFITAAAFLAVALGCVLAVDERPLHGPVPLAEAAAD
jgi:hypothetical protein